MLTMRAVADAETVDRHWTFLLQAVIGADPDFFTLLGRFCPDYASRIRKLLLDTNSDISASWLCLDSGQAIGLLAVHPLSTIQARQLVSLRCYLEGVTDKMAFRQALEAFAKQKAMVQSIESLYLTRIFVASSHRKGGIGAFLLSHMQHLQSEGAFSSCSLHVRNDNQGAIAFYQAHGFDWIDGGPGSAYRAMRRH